MEKKMKTLVTTFAMVILATAANAGSIEGRVGEVQPQHVDSARVSKYEQSQSSLSLEAPGATAEKSQGGRVAQKQSRPSSLQKSQKASYFYFHDALSSLDGDRDGDGYHSEFTVRFDADTTLGDERVYAKLYLRRVGESDWILYHVTEDFWINGESSDDDFYVRTTLDDGFSTSEYDALIDLYDSSSDEVVATVDYNDAPDLGLLPLEEFGLDVPIEEAGFSIGDVQTRLLIDDDQDGHYSKFEIAFDPDADLQAGLLYARVWIRAQGGDWIQEHVSENFPVDTFGQNDVYAFTAEWVSGYPTAYYDVQVDLYDATTDLLVASAGSERLDLSSIPLEDQTQDQKVSAPIFSGSSGAVSSHEHGGGAFAMTWLVLLALLTCGRRALTTRASVRAWTQE
jgi:hypothetical protein